MTLTANRVQETGVRPPGEPDISLGPIRNRTTPRTAASVLRTAILDGTLTPGSPLRETHLAADLGISRAPLREALGLLAEDGLVVKIAYKGAFVAEADATKIAEIASLRKRLEPFAIELAMPRLATGGRARVVRALREMARGADGENLAMTIDAHMSFHRAFYELSEHDLLIDLWRSWEGQLQLFHSIDHRSFANLHDVFAEHERLLTIIDSGDLEAITCEMDRHVHGQIEAGQTSSTETPRTRSARRR